MRSSLAQRVAMAAAVTGMGVTSTDERQRRRVWAWFEAGSRAATLIGVVGLITVDYKRVNWQARFSPANAAGSRSREKVSLAEQALVDADRIAKQAEQRLSAVCADEHSTSVVRRQAEREAKETMDAAADAAEVLVRSRKDAQASADTQMMADAHQRAADWLLWLARTNKGVYIKLAQHLAQLDYLLPDEYTRTLRGCFDDAPRSSYAQVQQVVTEELGAAPEDAFHTFDPVPIASASLAQVHVAYLKDAQGGRGDKVAVKVQHQGLRETAEGDVDAVSAVVGILGWIFPNMPLWWLADEIAPYLPVELDFEQEAHHAARCRALYQHDHRIHVPRVYEEFSKARVLTMSFEEGCNVTDVAAILGMGLKVEDVARRLTEAFNKQIFEAGFVHCDPHPANVLVRPSSAWFGFRNRPQLVLLDHGLYRSLDAEFTREYCSLWRSLLVGDVDGIRDMCQRMGAGDMYPLLAAMLTARPWNKIVDTSLDSLYLPDSDEERLKIKQYAAHYAVDIGVMLNQVPRQMLLLFKANDCLRHVDRQLGCSLNTVISTGIACLVYEPGRNQLHAKVQSWL